MSDMKLSLAADVAFVTLLLLLFVCMLFVSLNPDYFLFNGVALLIAFMVMIVTYFTSATSGLTINIILIFTFASYLLFGVLAKNTPIYSGSYFWIVMSPLLTTATGTIFRDTKIIEKDYRKLKRHMNEFAGIDEQTNLKNKQSYLLEVITFRGIARRYNLRLLLIVCEFRYARELKNLLGKDILEKLAVEISHTSESSFRKEDVPYLLSSEPYRWGMLMLTQPNSEQIIKNRMREKFESIDMVSLAGKHSPRLEMQIGVAYDSEEIDTPFQLLEEAIDQMQYDV
ncbi:MAG: diguanylate cyclase [Flexilinea sp.]|jgi:GGDEF domain-containing protein